MTRLPALLLAALAAASAGQAVAQVSPLPALTLRAEARDGRASVDAVVEAVQNAARTCKIGDGKIFVLDLESATRIRTGESGNEAL